MALYEVRYAVYNDPEKRSYDPNLWNCVQTIQAMNGTQAQAMIEAQFAGRAQVHAVFPVG